MAVYLGSQKVGVVINRASKNNSGYKCLKGTATSDEEGIITFPALDFTPNLIAVWNVSKYDLKNEADPEEEWDASYIRYVYEGSMLFAIRQGNQWISQGFGHNSSDVYITNASHNGGTDWAEETHPYAPSGILQNGNVYSYRLSREAEADQSEYADIEFNYAIYG